MINHFEFYLITNYNKKGDNALCFVGAISYRFVNDKCTRFCAFLRLRLRKSSDVSGIIRVVFFRYTVTAAYEHSCYICSLYSYHSGTMFVYFFVSINIMEFSSYSFTFFSLAC